MHRVQLLKDLRNYHPDLRVGALGVEVATMALKPDWRGDRRFGCIDFDDAGCWDILKFNYELYVDDFELLLPDEDPASL